MDEAEKINEWMISQYKYLQERVDKQIEWYDTKSINAKKCYKLLTYVILITSVFIPFLTNLAVDNFCIKVVVSLLGITTTPFSRYY